MLVFTCPMKKVVKSIISIICTIAILSFLLLFLTNHLVALCISLFKVPPHLTTHFLHIYLPYPVTIIGFGGTALLIYFLFLFSAIVVSVLFVIKNELKEGIKIFWATLRNKQVLTFSSKNSLILISQLFIAYYFFSFLYWQSLDMCGIYHMFNGEYYAGDMFKYINSPVYEEIYFRLILIGVPLFIIDFVKRKRKSIWRYAFGGFTIDFVALILLILSSIIFAFAHIFAGDPIYKLLPMIIIGFAFGYLFLKKGIHTSIILHFCLTYINMLPSIEVTQTYMEMLIGLFTTGKLPIISGTTAVFIGISFCAFLLLTMLSIIAFPFYFAYYTKKSFECIVKSIEKFMDRK